MPSEWNTKDADRYARAWHSYVARRNLVLVLFVSFIFVGGLVARLRLGELADFGILVVWIGVYLAGAWWMTQWTCPRCGKRFADRLWAPRCSTCGLAKEEISAMVHGRGPRPSGV